MRSACTHRAAASVQSKQFESLKRREAKLLILEVATLTVAGLLVGNELAIAAFVHPTLSRLPDAVHSTAASALARLLGRAMPFWYALTLVLTAALAFADHHRSGRWPSLIVLSAALWVLSIVYTIAALVPINNKIAAWTDTTRPADWKDLRSKWDTLHRWRVLLLCVAFVVLAAGILTVGARRVS